MKRILYILVVAAIMVSCQGVQDVPKGEQRMPAEQLQPDSSKPHPQMSREEKMEQLKMQKIAFMTDELKLTVEESQVFWPVYNRWWEENMHFTHEQYVLFKNINSNEKVTLADMEAIARSYEKQAELVRKWGGEFAKVLPEDKVARVFVVEERFKNYLIRKGPNWNKPGK